jgi:hypothetical protein
MAQARDRHVQRRVLPVGVRDRRDSEVRRMVEAVAADARMLRAMSVDFADAADPRHLVRRPSAADPFALRMPLSTATARGFLRLVVDTHPLSS